MPQTDLSPSIRLNKFIAQHLHIGRRQADMYIQKGRVLVDGQSAALGARIHPGTQQVTVDGKLLSADSTTAFIYLALHKPVGYVCSRRQQGDIPTIYTLLPPRYHHLKPVGRLDKDSSGILLLTNDGDFAHLMTHPSFHKIKQYEVSLDKPLAPLHRQMISDFGVDLADGKSQLHVEHLREGNEHEWRVTMHEGRNRQIRRTFAALGYKVMRLHRTQFGPFALGNITSGTIAAINPTK